MYRGVPIRWWGAVSTGSPSLITVIELCHGPGLALKPAPGFRGQLDAVHDLEGYLAPEGLCRATQTAPMPPAPTLPTMRQRNSRSEGPAQRFAALTLLPTQPRASQRAIGLITAIRP
jgi:hypothetical protein